MGIRVPSVMNANVRRRGFCTALVPLRKRCSAHVTVEEFVWTFCWNSRELMTDPRTILPFVYKMAVSSLPTETLIYTDYRSLYKCLIFISSIKESITWTFDVEFSGAFKIIPDKGHFFWAPFFFKHLVTHFPWPKPHMHTHISKGSRWGAWKWSKRCSHSSIVKSWMAAPMDDLQSVLMH